MADYSEPVPADLWERLEKELGVPKAIPMWRRWQAAAAVALLLVVSSLTVWFWHSSSADYIERQSMEAASVPGSGPVMQEPAGPERPAVETTLAKAAGETAPAETEMAVAAPAVRREEISEEANGKADRPAETEAVEKETAPLLQEKKAKAPEVEEKEAGENTRKPASRSFSKAKENTYYAYAAPKKKQDRKWAVGLAAGNSPFSAANGYNGYGRFRIPTEDLYVQDDGISPPGGLGDASVGGPTYPTGSKEYAYNQILLNNLAEEAVKSDVEHKVPVTFGVSLRFDLTERWAVESGLIYTMLSSDLRSGGRKSYYEQEQRLHYVGIPLKLNREIWGNRRFEVYASVGGAVEKCVSGKLRTTYVVGESDEAGESEDIKVKPLQWSLSAAAGAQFKITDGLGIYAEPGLAYYFDDGSEVSTIRKEHPLNFNIQLGVRFTLPK